MRNGNRLSFLLAMAALVLAAGCGRDEGGDQGPTLRDFEGYTVFVNYWAEWCEPCREEVPELNRFQQKYPDRVRVVGVNFDGATEEALVQQERKLGIEFPTLGQDPRRARGIDPPRGLPETLVFDQSGALVEVLVGPQHLEDLEGVLRQLEEES